MKGDKSVVYINTNVDECSARLVALNMQSPAMEFEDFDRVAKQYRTRVLQFLLAWGPDNRSER